MPANRNYGMDHDHYAWSPLPQRPALAWPGGEPLAFGAVVLLEHYEWTPPVGAYSLRSASGGLAALPPPDYPRMTHREYGHRVGIFRVLDTLEEHGVPATIAIDVLTAVHYPWLVEHCVERGCEVMAHGVAASRLMTEKMGEAEEIETIGTSIDTIERVTGTRPRGWFSPEGVESTRTPRLLAAAGVEYVCDWPNDEQPYQMTVPEGTLVSLPLFQELDDEFALWHRRARAEEWSTMVAEAATRLHADGANAARHLLLTLRPWLIGQPMRIGALRAALEAVSRLDGVWRTRAGDLAAAAPR
ncbi:MAG: polysaccharide deacetylase family protein [Actinomycetia bacterium]|nr:polysaccharide deacetylase family protein [Actinomycetes bacterium]